MSWVNRRPHRQLFQGYKRCEINASALTMSCCKTMPALSTG
jgi:hypothetical protein